MKDRRGPLGRTFGALTQGITGAARRRQSDREPRVVIYDSAGRPDLVRSDLREHSEIVEIAERMLEIAAAGPVKRRSGLAAGDDEEPA